ncbi:MAG: nuclear transport factor 2 family protein [Candidatus Diapherotrites archaeon]|nr:nuclear transport factor 2 family protein [Candidatus Diapherotrites archaeon]
MQVVEQFIDRINAHSVEGIVRLMTDDHLFVDGLGQAISGRDAMRQAWKMYFEWMPDYRIDIEQKFERDGIVGLFGRASGTHAVGGELREENRWAIPAAWRAVVRGGLVAEWQVYADNKPVYEIMSHDPKLGGSG